MSQAQPANTEDSGDRGLTFRSVLPISIVSLCLMFFQGCENNRIQLTTGPFVSFAEIDYDEDSPLDSDLTYFSIPRLALNVLGLGVLLVVLPQYSKKLRRILSSPELRVAILVVALVFNSIIYFHQLWVNAVFWPTSNLTDLLVMVLGEPATATGERLIVALAARMYFVFCWIALTLLLLLSKWVARRYVFVDPDRWWQFNLQSFLLATFVVGTSLGLLLRFWR